MIKRYVYESEEQWLKARELVFTSSEVNRLMAEPTKKAKEAGQLLSDGAITYILEKVAARFEAPKPIYFNNEMQWGKDNEPTAALRLCEMLGYDPASDDVIYTSQGGLVFFNYMSELGGTPDMIFPNAIGEIKCPNSDTHLYYKAFVNSDNFQSELPKYYDQCQTNMFLSERTTCYFMSFDPRFSDDRRQVHLIEVKRDQDRINQILNKVSLAFEEMNRLIDRL
jgi:hypothetical protein